MPPDASHFLNLFVTPPGDLLYFLVVFAIGQVSLFMALGQRLRRPSERAPRIYTTASVVMVGAWALLMVGALLALAAGLPARALLPPMERLAQAVTVIAIGWAFINAESDRWARSANFAALILIALVILGYVFTGLEWVDGFARAEFNQSTAGATWTFSIAAFAALGAALMLARVRDILDAPLKLVFFAVLLIGFGYTLVQMANSALVGDAAGASRLAFVAAGLILPTVIYRTIVGRLEDEIVFAQTALQPRPVPVAMSLPSTLMPASLTVERESAQLMKALGLMLEGAAPDNIPQRVLTAAITSLKADIGAILTVHDAHYADLLLGMDRVMDREIAALSLNLDDQPTLLNAIERRQQRALYPDRNEDEIADLYARLDIQGSGPVYLQPLTRGKDLVAVLLVGMPYARRELSDSEQELLKGIGIIGANLLALSNASHDARIEAESRLIQAMIQGMPPTEVGDDTALHMWEEMRTQLESSRQQVDDLNQQIASLRGELDNERSRVALALDDTSEGKAISQRIIALNDDVSRTMEERDRLSAQLRNAETALASTATDDDASLYSTLIDSLKRETAELTAQRDVLRAQLASIRQDEPTEPDAQAGDEAERSAAVLIERLNEEKLRTERDRDHLGARLAEIEGQFSALGIEGGAAGMAQIVGQLYEQRAGLQARFDALKAERDALFAERASLQELALKEGEREGRLQILQAEVTHLASDREAVGKQRERFRVERDDLNLKLNALRDQQARLLAELAGYAQELTEEQAEHGQLRAAIEQLSNERSDLVRERDQLLVQQQALELERDGLMARVSGDRERLEQLGSEGVGSLTRIIADLTEQRAAIEHELHQTRTTLAAAEDQLDLMQIRSGNAQGQIIYRPDNPELLVNMVEELRTPMTSISGYVDLVLNESAGILGEMQRKFMQRVASNLLRLQTMIDDLVQITALDAGYFKLARESVDMIALIEDALMLASQALREKGLTVHLKLDETAPPVLADRDKMTQVIGQFLTNAYLVSPPGTDLYIGARMEETAHSQNGHGEPRPALHVTIEDRGGGIAPEEVGSVFARRYRADNPLIRGLGDTGVGLAIAQALVVAHEGEVWVESQVGRGSIFHFTVPLQAETTPMSLQAEPS